MHPNRNTLLTSLVQHWKTYMNNLKNWQIRQCKANEYMHNQRWICGLILQSIRRALVQMLKCDMNVGLPPGGGNPASVAPKMCTIWMLTQSTFRSDGSFSKILTPLRFSLLKKCVFNELHVMRRTCSPKYVVISGWHSIKSREHRYMRIKNWQCC